MQAHQLRTGKGVQKNLVIFFRELVQDGYRQVQHALVCLNFPIVVLLRQNDMLVIRGENLKDIGSDVGIFSPACVLTQ
jgi:hypothetical protein